MNSVESGMPMTQKLIISSAGAFCIEINPEEKELSQLYDKTIRSTASQGLSQLFN